MGSKTGLVDSDTSEELHAIMRTVNASVDSADAGGAVFSALIEQLSDITIQRTLRISMANQSLPIRLKILLLFMGAVLVTGFLIMPVANVYVQVLMTATLTMSIHLLSPIIEDLDHPFHGVWNLDRTPLQKLIDRLQSDLKKITTRAAT
jgi:hypothetical protein